MPGSKMGSGRLIEMSECVLALIDMQDKLLNIMSERDKTLDNNVKLAKFAGIVGLPVLVTEQENLGPTSPALSEEIPGFDPVMKMDFDACREPEFLEALRRTGGSTVAVTGIESHICVAQTVLHLLPDYEVHVIADAVASRDPSNREVALDRMREAGAVISSTEMFMYELLVRAGTDRFREVLKLVK